MRPPRLICHSRPVPFRCLIVDDNQRFLEVARRSLEGQGLDVVHIATSIDTALAAIEAGRPDVVLIDVSLGEESGFELLRRLIERFPHLAGRGIMISTRAEEDYTDLMDGMSAAGFLAKSALSVNAIRALIPGLP
jgi:DNA-binding NarL/FixJ family response regulator